MGRPIAVNWTRLSYVLDHVDERQHNHFGTNVVTDPAEVLGPERTNVGIVNAVAARDMDEVLLQSIPSFVR